MTYLLFATGLVGLFLGGEVLIRGAVGVARHYHVSPLIIGLTIVGFGTSAPELLVSVQSALAGVPDIAVGNVVGSNIANILLILGTGAMIAVVPIQFGRMIRDFVAMLGATVLVWVLMLNGALGRAEGAVLVAGLAVYMWLCLRNAAGAHPPEIDEPVRPLWQSAAMALAGLVILAIGARLLVFSATDIARSFGVSEAVIGLTIVAVGTSLPELATGILAAIRKHGDLAVGNVLGSNVFNLLGILGATALVKPIPIDPRFTTMDLPLALIASLAMAGFAIFAGHVGRIGGVALLIAYAGYVGTMGSI